MKRQLFTSIVNMMGVIPQSDRWRGQVVFVAERIPSIWRARSDIIRHSKDVLDLLIQQQE